MLKTDIKNLSPEQRAMNEMACEFLVRGGTYRFDPPVNATAVPTGGPNTCPLADVDFDMGWYIGFVDGAHVFQGRPANDPRMIPVPDGYEDAPDPDEIDGLRDSYFHVAFIGGWSVPTLISAGPQG
jgi:hypothetical protein